MSLFVRLGAALVIAVALTAALYAIDMRFSAKRDKRISEFKAFVKRCESMGGFYVWRTHFGGGYDDCVFPPRNETPR